MSIMPTPPRVPLTCTAPCNLHGSLPVCCYRPQLAASLRICSRCPGVDGTSSCQGICCSTLTWRRARELRHAREAAGQPDNFSSAAESCTLLGTVGPAARKADCPRGKQGVICGPPRVVCSPWQSLHTQQYAKPLLPVAVTGSNTMIQSASAPPQPAQQPKQSRRKLTLLGRRFDALTLLSPHSGRQPLHWCERGLQQGRWTPCAAKRGW